MLGRFRCCDGELIARVHTCINSERNARYTPSIVKRRLLRLLSNAGTMELRAYLDACHRALCVELAEWVDAWVVGDSRYYQRVKCLTRANAGAFYDVYIAEEAIIERTFKSYSVEGLSPTLRLYTLLWVMEHEQCSLQQIT